MGCSGAAVYDNLADAEGRITWSGFGPIPSSNTYESSPKITTSCSPSLYVARDPLPSSHPDRRTDRDACSP